MKTKENNNLSIKFYSSENNIEIGKSAISLKAWNSRNYQESAFRSVKERNVMMEHLVMMVNSQLIDYHYHHHTEYYYSVDDGRYHQYLLESDSKEDSIAVLTTAKSYNEELLSSIFSNGWQNHICYLRMALSLMYEIYQKLEGYEIHLNMENDLNAIANIPASSPPAGRTNFNHLSSKRKHSNHS